MRALIVSVDLGSPDYQAHAQEFEMLATGAGAELVGTLKARRQRPDAAYFIGSGKVQEGVLLAEQGEAEVVLFDQPLSPAQQRNLERQFNLRVVDRVALILDIFALRAKSHEGKLQVELAQLQHLSTRLTRLWSHLERQRGGIGMRGPGESQLEMDRRMIGAFFVARKVKRLTTGRVIGFVEADLCVVAHTVADQPVDTAGAVRAIALHHVLGNDTLQLPHEVLEHLARAVRDPGPALHLGLACIHDAAAARSGAAAAKAIEHQHLGARFTRRERSAGTGPAKARHDHVGNAVPVDLARIGNAQRRLGVSVLIHASGPVRGAWRAADIALRYSPVAAQARENCSHSIRIRFASCHVKACFSPAKNDFGLHDALTLEKRLPRPYSPPVMKNHQRSAAMSGHARGLYG